MFQDIAPHCLHIDFRNPEPKDTDYLIACNKNTALIGKAEHLIFPTIADARKYWDVDTNRLIYLFDIDDKAFFLSPPSLNEVLGFIYHDIRSLRNAQPCWLCFAAATAMHLTFWYDANRFCGKCAHPMMPKEDERALCCPHCGQVVYPRINPVVIVGVTDGERLLLGKNINATYKNYSLISGFMEVSESFEETVKREVMEEVGLKVKNMRYYKSQPWAFSESVLMGFFAEVDGDTEPFLDGRELTEAVWFTREELPVAESRFSLTWDMIESFRLREV